MIKKATKLLFFIILCQAAGIIGSIFAYPSIQSWYPYITKPFFTPPSFIFAPVWITIFTLMGISIYLAWENKKVKFSRLLTLIR